MLKKHMAACLVASAFITMPVLAQTSTTPGATSPGANPPATTAPSTGGAMGAGSGAAAGGSGRFITEQQGTQWRASKLIGLDIYGADNQKIGDVNEVLVDRQGNADAVVVGVGGFLGIGEKNVALPFSAFEWQMDDTRRTASAGTSGTTATTGTAGTAGTAGSPATRSDTTASTSAPAGSASSSRSSTDRGYPDHAVLRMSKADLENAPTFRYVGENRSDSSSSRSTSGSSSPATGTGASSPSTAPKQ